jgi:hypothetical protein
MGGRAKDAAKKYARVEELSRFVSLIEETVSSKGGGVPFGIIERSS